MKRGKELKKRRMKMLKSTSVQSYSKQNHSPNRGWSTAAIQVHTPTPSFIWYYPSHWYTVNISISLYLFTDRLKGIKTSRVLYVSACLSDLWIRYICNSLSAHLQNESCLHKWFWFYETAIANRVQTHFYVFNMLYYPLKQLH